MGGAGAGLAVDVFFFPLDTLKTRLQSSQGFVKAGGFKNIYRGLGTVVTGSMPSSALFFGSYTFAKQILSPSSPSSDSSPHLPNIIVASCFGEVVACGVRVPVEMVKQQMQVRKSETTGAVIKNILKTGGIRSLYSGYLITVMRDIPFSVIQFPLWEYLKNETKKRREITVVEEALCGSISGGVAGFLTTPLDVVKTRVMLGESRQTIGSLFKEGGVKVFFSGVVPRTLWLSLGGGVYLGVFSLLMNSI